MARHGSYLGQNYLFGNIITNHGHFEMKLGQYVYFHGISYKIPRFIQIGLFLTQFGPYKVDMCAKFWAKFPFWQYHHQSLSFGDETRSVCVFQWNKLGNSEIHANLAIFYTIWARLHLGPNMGQKWAKLPSWQ